MQLLWVFLYFFNEKAALFQKNCWENEGLKGRAKGSYRKNTCLEIVLVSLEDIVKDFQSLLV